MSYGFRLLFSFLFYLLPTFQKSSILHTRLTLYYLLMQLLTVISTIDDLNYPEKTDTYYVVNVPYIFSACWKVCAS